MGNKIHDRDHVRNFPGGEYLAVMAETIQQAGYEIMTIDVYRKTCSQRKALLVADIAAGLKSYPPNLIPLIAYVIESPIIASRQYYRVGNKTAKFYKIMGPHGMRSRIPKAEARFIPTYWPTTQKYLEKLPSWNERKFLVLIAGNGKALEWQWPKTGNKNIKSLARALISNLNTTWIKTIDPLMKSNLYLERLKAIQYFSAYEGFDLYGAGWDTDSSGLETDTAQAIMKSWRGLAGGGHSDYYSKYKYLKQYRFSICFENTAFPGWITEKIFDCFVTGVIPVYLGAPDVAEKIPRNCFIDVHDFRNYEELGKYLELMTPEVASRYLEAAKTFLESDAFTPFTSKHFADTIVNCLDEFYQ